MRYLTMRYVRNTGKRWLLCFAALALVCSQAESGWIIGPERWIASENYLPSEPGLFDAHIVIDGPMATLRHDSTRFDYLFTYWKGVIRYRGPVANPFQKRIDHTTDSSLYPNNDYLRTPMVCAWILNVHKRPASNELLGLVHVEDLRNCVVNYDEHVKYRISLAYTNQGSPTSWSYVDTSIIAPHWDTAGDGTLNGNNLAGGPYIVKNDSMYIYFNERIDMIEQNPPLITNVIVGVAKASLTEVLANAARGVPTQWKKYYKGAWNEPGFGGRASNIIPNYLSDNINLHADAAYCRPLKKFLLLAPAMHTHRLLMYSSTDGVTWGDPVTIDSLGDYHHEHCFFAATSDATADCREVGETFKIIFPRRQTTGPNKGRITMHYKKVTLDTTSNDIVYKQRLNPSPLGGMTLRN